MFVTTNALEKQETLERSGSDYIQMIFNLKSLK